MIRGFWVVALIVVMTAKISGGQMTTTSSVAGAPPAPVKIYAVGKDGTAPELLPPSQTSAVIDKCKKRAAGKVTLAVVIDEKGKPSELTYLHPLGTVLDQVAFDTVAADRFKPGTHDGATAAVAESVEVSLQGCIEKAKDSEGKTAYQLRLRSQPEQTFAPLRVHLEKIIFADLGDFPRTGEMKKSSSENIPDIHQIGNGVSAPVPLFTVEPEFSDEARNAKYSGKCLLSLVVDSQGKPQEIRLRRPLGMGLDEKAIEAASKYRFKPAMYHGVPVAVRIAIEENFRIY
jgi:TonB family protein